MNEAQALQVVECQGQRILTTAQIARAFDATEQQVRNNFNRNKDKYQEGTHYIRLVGQEKEAFLGKTQFEFNLLSTKPLYLWTEQGAFLHAKSLNTDRAWQAYALLVAEYYHLKRLVETQTATVQRPMNNLFYARAISHLKDGYWCIYGELQVYVKYYPALVRNGVPDESVAHYWIQHLKAHPDRFDLDRIGKYHHSYPDQRGTVRANAYPDEWLLEFRTWLRAVYIPLYLPKYLKSRQLPETEKLQALSGPALRRIDTP